MAFPAEEKAVLGIILLLFSDHGLEFRPVLGGVLDQFINALVELGVSGRGRRGRDPSDGGVERVMERRRDERGRHVGRVIWRRLLVVMEEERVRRRRRVGVNLLL